MWSKVKSLFKKDNQVEMLATLLAQSANKEELLGMKKVNLPTPDSIRRDAARIVRHSKTDDYQTWANEAWGRIIEGLDKVLDDKSSDETRRYYCGVVKATLDLLRVSYVAKFAIEEAGEEQSAPLRQDNKK